MKTVVIIPTYNEKENIDLMLKTVMELDEIVDVLIVDDNSPDGTADLVEKNQEKYPNRIFLEKRPDKNGLGTAYIHGFKWAIANKYDFVLEMDCDFSHPPKDITNLLAPLKSGKYQLTVGSRYTKGGRVENWPFTRWLLSYFASIYVRMILFIGIKDTTAGFIGYNIEVLKAINLDNIPFKGYAFQICMKYAAIKKGFKAKEVPIVFIDRVYGQSKMSTSIFKEAILGVWKMRGLKL